MTSFTKKAQDLFLQGVRQFTEFGAKASEVADQLFQTLVSLGVESPDDLKVGVAKNKGKTAILSVEFLGRLQETICRQKFPKQGFIMAYMKKDDPRLTGEGEGNLAMTPDNCRYWQDQKGTAMKDFRNAMKTRFNRAKSVKQGGARVASLPHERLLKAITEAEKARKAAQTSNKFKYDLKICGTDTESELNLWLAEGRAIAARLEQTKPLISE